jgi:chemotaxis protein MotC
LQDKIAVGNREAHLYQRQLLSEIAKKLPHVSDDDWRQPRNSRAGIVYALSGGDPAVLTKLLSLSPLPCVDETLIKGLLEYSQGQNEEAWKNLSSFDPLLIEPRAGGHLALAQAMLLAQEDPKKAMRYLDEARILAPGTLIEEAALRREAIFAATVEDFRTFRMLTSQYLRRFNKSVYAGDFIRRFAAAVSTSKYAEDERLFHDLTEALDLLDPEPRQLAYLAIAKTAIARGRLKLTEITARKLAEFAKDDPTLTAQARLFEAAAVLVTKDYDRAVTELKAVDRSALPIRVQPLLDAALNLAERLRLPPQGTPPASAPPPVSAEQGKHVESPKLHEVVDEANAAIGKADDLMKGDAK